jgi:hypothetical protein
MRNRRSAPTAAATFPSRLYFTGEFAACHGGVAWFTTHCPAAAARFAGFASQIVRFVVNVGRCNDPY